jgi:hypothetical protein
MADILNLQVKDETLKNIISNNPYYIDIKGSVNICLIRCGQEIENCNSVNFSTMTNYGKILVLNPDKSKLTKCNIKLAFDNTNDTLNDKGESNYKFEKAFFTVPSLHKLNGQIFDMETFLLFSSLQKNGTILYVCLCTFNTGTNIVQNGDPKLLNFKLLNELFSKNNSVPDMYGTNQINGIPNPVDISNFIPHEGSRNFYDYTHPSNTKVNFRIFQTPMYVSNDIITILKSKLTPGNIYTNFKEYINKSINPPEGLFFYFSEDLTNRYKSFQSNNTNQHQKDSFENISDSILEEQELHEKEENFKKLEIKKTIISEEDETDNNEVINNNEIKKAESFSDSKKNETNQSITIIIFIVSFMLIVNFLYIIFINNFFTPVKNIDDSDLPNYLSEIISQNMKTILGTKFKYYYVLFWQSIITFIVIILLIIYMSNNSNEQSIYTSILVFLFLIFINGIIICILNIRYFIYRLKSIYDDDFSQKENYLFNYIVNETYKSNTFNNIMNIIKEDFSSFIRLQIQLNPQVGGGDNNIQENNIYHNSLVPGPKNVDESLKIYKDKDILDKISFFNFYKLFDSNVVSIIYEKFKNNKSWTTNGYILILIIILFFIIGILFQLKYVSTGNNSLLKIIVSLIVLSCLYLPIIISIISLGYYFAIDYKLQIAVIVVTIIGLIIALFIPVGIVGDKKKNWLSNIPFWLCISFFIMSILLIIIGKYVRKDLFDRSSSDGGDGTGKSWWPFSKKSKPIEASAPPINEYYEVLKVKLEEEENKRILYQKELENLYLIDEIKDEKIKKLSKQQGNNNYTQNLENELLVLKDKLNEYKEKSILYKESTDNNKNSEILSLEEKIKNLKEKLLITENEYEKNLLEKQIENLKSQLITLKETLKESDDNYVENLENEILLLKDKLQEYKEKSVLYYESTNNINKKSEILVLQEKIKNLEIELSKTLDKSEKEFLEKQIENLNLQLTTLKETLNKSNKNYVEKLENEILVLNKQIENLENKLLITGNESEKKLLKKQIENLNSQLTTLKETLKESDKNYVEKIENELLLLKDKLQEYKEKSILYNKSTNNINKNSEISSLKEQIKNLKIKLLNTGSQNEKELLKKQIENFEKILENKNKKINGLGNEIIKLEKNLLTNDNKDSSLLVLKDIKDEQKEKEILFKEYYEYSIDDLKNHIQKILEYTRIFKLYTVTTNLLFTKDLIDKLKKLEEKRSDINYNEEILRILNKLNKINPLEDINDDFKEEFNGNLEHLNSIKQNKLYKDMEKELSSITLKIKNIVSQIKKNVVKN